MRKVLLFLMLLVAGQTVFSQSFKQFNFTVSEGLPSVETYEVFQDSRGFLWFASDNGVCRYDGRNIEVFHVKDGLTDPVVFGFSEDHKGRIWFRTYSGQISYYHNGKIVSYQYNELLRRLCEYRILMAIHYDSLDQLWFGTGEIIGKITADGQVDTTRLKRHQIELRMVGDVTLMAYAGSTNQVRQFVYGNKRFPIQLSDTLHAYHVVRSEWWKGKLYLTLNNNIFEYADGNFKRVFVGPAPIICMSKDREDNMWVGYMNYGVERYPENFANPDLSLYRDKSVTKVLQDHEGGLWFSTLQNGVYYIPNANIEKYQPSGYTKVKAVALSNGLIVTGDNAGTVKAIDPRSRKQIWVRKFADPVLCLYPTKRNELWISTTTKSFLFDSTGRLRNTNPVGRVDFVEDPDGITWSINGTMIYRSDTLGNMIGEPKNIYRSIAMVDTLLLLAGRSGLQVMNRKLEILMTPPAFENVKISQMAEVNDSTFIITTIGHGFFLLNTKKWTTRQYSPANRFSASNVYTVLLNDSSVWLGTDKGIAVCNVTDILADRPSYEFLHQKSGLVSDKIDLLIPADGKIWAYADDGISIFNKATRYSNQRPRFSWARITANQQNLTDTANLTLASDRNNIEIEYRAIAFNNPNISIRYRITPQERWTINPSPKILLYSLAPGAYAFELQYSADNVIWHPALPVLKFSIEMPWYRRWYTYALLLIIFATFGYLYFRHLRRAYLEKNSYLRIINDHQQRLIQSEVTTVERERNRIAKELHDGVGTNLTAIKLSVRQLLHSHNEPRADDIEEQFQVAIGEIKNIIYDLSPPGLERYGLFAALRNYITRLSTSVHIPINFKTFGNEVRHLELNLIVFRIVQELLSNSIKHSRAEEINVHINSFEDLMNIIYEDNGIGFQYDPVQSGLGLDNIDSRIRSVNGTLKFESGDFGVSYTIDIPVPKSEKKTTI